MLPYIVTIIVLIFTSIRNKRENQPPASLGLSYFREEDDPGYSSVNDTPVLDADGISIFYTNTDSEEIEVANYSIIEIEDAVSAVEEFFETLQLPKCIEWEEL